MAADQQEVVWDWMSVKEEIKKKVIEKSTWEGNRPIEGSECKIIISDIEGEWNSNLKVGEEVCFKIGSGDSTFEEQIERCLFTMDKEEVALFQIGNTKCQIKMLEFNCPETPEYCYDVDDSIKVATDHKEKGVEHFKNGMIIEAYARFRRAIRILIFAGKKEEKILPLYLTVCNNIAICHIKLNRPELGIEVCNKVIELDGTNVKAYLRRSICYNMTRDFEKAHSDLLKVLELEPSNPTAKEMMPTLKADLNDMNQRYKSMIKKMFKYE